MRLAADRDSVARQYGNDFAEVFWVAERIAEGGQPLGTAIVEAFLHLLAEHPDTLIARKCGVEVSREVSLRAAEVRSWGKTGDDAFDRGLADFDFWLRTEGHRLNPGTSADLIAAGLFVLLRENRLEWPVRFYGEMSG